MNRSFLRKLAIIGTLFMIVVATINKFKKDDLPGSTALKIMVKPLPLISPTSEKKEISQVIVSSKSAPKRIDSTISNQNKKRIISDIIHSAKLDYTFDQLDQKFQMAILASETATQITSDRKKHLIDTYHALFLNGKKLVQLFERKAQASLTEKELAEINHLLNTETMQKSLAAEHHYNPASFQDYIKQTHQSSANLTRDRLIEQIVQKLNMISNVVDTNIKFTLLNLAKENGISDPKEFDMFANKTMPHLKKSYEDPKVLSTIEKQILLVMSFNLKEFSEKELIDYIETISNSSMQKYNHLYSSIVASIIFKEAW